MPSVQEFFEAITAGNVGQVKQMVEAQPSLLQAINEMGDTPLLWAAYQGREAVAALLLEQGAGLDIFEAAAVGKADRVGALLREDLSLATAYSHDGWTALHLACLFGSRESAEALLAGGADVQAVTQSDRFVKGGAPLHAAVAGGRKGLVELLLKAGAAPSAPDSDGRTPLHIAAASGNAEVARLLLLAGADPNVSMEGDTPLTYAREGGYRKVVDLLRRHGGR